MTHAVDRGAARRDEQRLRLRRHRPARRCSAAIGAAGARGRCGPTLAVCRARHAARRSGAWPASTCCSRTRRRCCCSSAATAAPTASDGLRWANPFYAKTKISVRAHNFNSEKLKVNDLRGNPIEIAAAIVWRVDDTALASFDVENYEAYVLTQAESAVRHLALSYAYDNLDEPGATQHDRGDAALGHRGGRRRRCATSCSSASPRPASSSSTPSSPTSPTRRRSPARCCAGSRPRR